MFVLDSRFCVLNTIVELKRGLFAAALIKKRHYWLKHVPGDTIIAHIADKGAGEVDALQGTLERVLLHIHAMKEPDYMMMLMLTYGMMAECRDQKKQTFLVDGGQEVKML